MNKIIAVTGANGFIGSNIIKLLLKNNNGVIAIVRPETNLEPLKSTYGYNLVIAKDFTEPFLLIKLADMKCDVVINCAWQGNNLDQRNASYQALENMKVTIKLLEMVKNINCKHLINIGSLERGKSIHVPA